MFPIRSFDIKKKTVPAVSVFDDDDIEKRYYLHKDDDESPEDYTSNMTFDPTYYSHSLFFISGIVQPSAASVLEAQVALPRKVKLCVWGYPQKVFVELKGIPKRQKQQGDEINVKKWNRHVVSALIDFFKVNMSKKTNYKGTIHCKGGGPVESGEEVWENKVNGEWKSMRGALPLTGFWISFMSEEAARKFGNFINFYGKNNSNHAKKGFELRPKTGRYTNHSIYLRHSIHSPLLRVHHHNIPGEVKIMSELGLEMNGWLGWKESIPSAISEVLHDPSTSSSDNDDSSSDDDSSLHDAGDSRSLTRTNLEDGITVFVHYSSLFQIHEDDRDKGWDVFSDKEYGWNLCQSLKDEYLDKWVSMPMPRYLSFDIETNSTNPNSKLPDASVPGNKCYQIAVIVGDLGSGVTDEKHLFTLFKADEDGVRVPKNLTSSCTISTDSETKEETKVYNVDEGDNYENIVLHEFDEESDLIIAFSKLYKETCPDYIITYNGLKFDWEYLVDRSEMNNITEEFLDLENDTYIHLLTCESIPSTLLNEEVGTVEIIEKKWNSNAYGEQVMRWVDTISSVNLDLYIEIQKNHKLSTYNLKFVSSHFLNDTKDDITPRQLFMIYEFNDVVRRLTTSSRKRDVVLYFHKDGNLDRIFPRRKCGTGEMLELRDSVENASSVDELLTLARKAVSISGRYCVQDTALPIRLTETQNVIFSMEQMSNVSNVPIAWLNVRGQQIKVVSHVYKLVMKLGFIINYTLSGETNDDNYEGATVIEAVTGVFDDVIPLDFASLYPTTMISYNIDYTTFSPEGKVHTEGPRKGEVITDDECHIISWSSHVGCEHDPKKRKRDKDRVICGDNKYRFLRSRIEIVENTPSGGERSIEDRFTVIRHNEGVFPQMERTLLRTRKQVKKRLAKKKAILSTHLGKADDQEIAFYNKVGWKIVKKGELTPREEFVLKQEVGTLDANQKALKINANSAYGITGAVKGYMPFIQGAASITATGRYLINLSIRIIQCIWDGESESSVFVRESTGERIPVKAFLVYGDTDSCMFTFAGVELSESFIIGDQAGVISTHVIKCSIMDIPTRELFTLQQKEGGSYSSLRNSQIEKYGFDTAEVLRATKPFTEEWLELDNEMRILCIEYHDIPMDLELEGAYGEFILLTKKRYVATNKNRKGKVLKMTWKGVCATRRDNTSFLRDTYRIACMSIINKENPLVTLDKVYSQINKLFVRGVNSKEFVYYMGIKSLINYAKKKKIKGRNRGEEREEFVDKEGNRLVPQPTQPDDPRLVWPTIPQVCLARKIMARSGIESIPGNTRLEYLYLRDDSAVRQGDQAEDYSYYLENRKEGMRLKMTDLTGEFTMVPDELLMFEKQLIKPLTELIDVIIPPRKRIYKTPLDFIYEISNETCQTEGCKYINGDIDTHAGPSKGEDKDWNRVPEYISAQIRSLKSSKKPDTFDIKIKKDAPSSHIHPPPSSDGEIRVGWSALYDSFSTLFPSPAPPDGGEDRRESVLAKFRRFATDSILPIRSVSGDRQFTDYKYTRNKGLDALYEHLHASGREGSHFPSRSGCNNIIPSKHRYIWEKITQYKSRHILDKLSAKYGVGKRKNYYVPKHTSERLRENVPVLISFSDACSLLSGGTHKACADPGPSSSFSSPGKGREGGARDISRLRRIICRKDPTIHSPDDIPNNYQITCFVISRFAKYEGEDESFIDYEVWREADKEDTERMKDIRKILRDDKVPKEKKDEAYKLDMEQAKKRLPEGRYDISSYLKSASEYKKKKSSFYFDVYIPVSSISEKKELHAQEEEEQDDEENKDDDGDEEMLLTGDTGGDIYLSKVPREILSTFYYSGGKRFVQDFEYRRGWHETNVHLQDIFNRIYLDVDV